MRSESQINASRENGKLSRGPITQAGRDVCKRNAIKHALTGATVLLPTDDLEAFDKFSASIEAQYQPKNDPERRVVQAIADAEWRLLRISKLESGYYAYGRIQQADSLTEIEDPAIRAIIVESLTNHEYSASIANLGLQQTRLERTLERRIKQFEAMRAEREVLEVAAANTAMHSITGDPEDTSPPHPTVGSVFSFEFLIARLEFYYAHPKANIAIFDRTWRDKKAKTAA